MAESYSTESLDYWRKFFNCANADIFQVIKFAILVASADCPSEFLSWRDQITEILYTCWPIQCSSDRAELQTPEIEDTQKETETTTSNQQSTSSTPQDSKFNEFEALTNEIEEEQQTVGEVLRIKGVLTNWKEESEKGLSESLRRLQLMELTVETLGATNIGRAVSALYKHKSKPIRQLARTLVNGWKLLVDEWMKANTVSQEPSPVSMEPSPAEEETLLPSELDFPPLDMGALLATQTASFEFSKIFEGMDEDGNPTSTRELMKNGRKPQHDESVSIRKDNGEINREVEEKALKPKNATHKASKPKDSSSCPLPEKPSSKATTYQNNEQRQKTEERYAVAPKAPKPIDLPLKASKTSKDILSTSLCERPSVRAPAHRNSQQRQKASGVTSNPCPSRKDVSKEPEELSYRAKLEVAKRKLQDRYQEAKDAKRQRTIQVMELKDLPKQAQNKQQPINKRGNFLKRSLNIK